MCSRSSATSSGGIGTLRAGRRLRASISAFPWCGLSAPGARGPYTGGQHPKAAPAPRTGNTGSAAVVPQHVLDLHFQDRPAGDNAALVPGGRAEAGGGGARAPVLVRFIRANPLNRPRHAHLAMCRNKPVQHGRRPRIGRQVSTLAALAVGEEDQPSLEAASITRRAEGTASLVALAMVMASGIGWPAARAASCHVES
jgi:hypothetical protein